MGLRWISGGFQVDFRWISGGLQVDWRWVGGGLEVDGCMVTCNVYTCIRLSLVQVEQLVHLFLLTNAAVVIGSAADPVMKLVRQYSPNTPIAHIGLENQCQFSIPKE